MSKIFKLRTGSKDPVAIKRTSGYIAQNTREAMSLVCLAEQISYNQKVAFLQENEIKAHNKLVLYEKIAERAILVFHIKKITDKKEYIKTVHSELTSNLVNETDILEIIKIVENGIEKTRG